jgi:hypothetical protein
MFHAIEVKMAKTAPAPGYPGPVSERDQLRFAAAFWPRRQR